MRSEPPSENRIAELRRSGAVPYSPLATALLCASALLLFTAFLTDRLPLGIDLWRMADGPEVLQDPEVHDMLRESMHGVVVLTGGVLGVALLVALVQTRFLLRKTIRGPREPRQRGFALAVLSGAGYVLFSLWSIPFGLSLFRNRYPEIGGSLLELFRTAVIGLCICGLFGAVLAIIFARLHFYQRHRMTREEIRREASGLD